MKANILGGVWIQKETKAGSTENILNVPTCIVSLGLSLLWSSWSPGQRSSEGSFTQGFHSNLHCWSLGNIQHKLAIFMLSSAPSSVSSAGRWPFPSHVHIFLLLGMFKKSLNKRSASRSGGSLATHSVAPDSSLLFSTLLSPHHLPRFHPSTGPLSSQPQVLPLKCLSNPYGSLSIPLFLPWTTIASHTNCNHCLQIGFPVQVLSIFTLTLF